MNSRDRISILVLLFLSAVMPFSFECIYPFINEMLVEIGVVDDPSKTGFYSGCIESIFALGQLITVFPVTRLSDKYGRKPIILLGALGIACATGIIGISTALWMLVLSRALGGLAGGYGTAIRVMICEIAGEAKRSSYLNYASLAYCAGQILGQAFGGMLAHPEKRFKLFNSPFWKRYPFALPCFVGSAYAFFFAFIGFLILRETVPQKKNKGDKRNAEATESSPLLPPADDEKEPEPSPSIRSVLTFPLVSLFVSMVLFCLIIEAFFAVFPLYSFTPVELGGLGLTEAQIGVQMACRAVIFLSILSLYPKIEKRVGALRAYNIAMLSWPVTIAILPTLNMIARRGGEGTWLWYFTMGMTMLSWSFNSLGWTAMYVLAANHSPSPAALGTVQGIASFAELLCCFMGPSIGTTNFAIGLQHPDFLGGYSFWIIAFILSCIAAAHSFTLKEKGENCVTDSTIPPAHI